MSSGSNNIGSIRFRSQGTTDGSFHDGGPTGFMQVNGEVPEEVGASAEGGVKEVPL